MLKITDVDYVKDYQLLLTFYDGTRKMADLKPYLTGEVFGELLDLKKFTQYGLTGYTIEWANGADLAPEFLYDIGSATLVRPNFRIAFDFPFGRRFSIPFGQRPLVRLL